MHSISSVGLAAQTGTTSEVSEVMNNCSKRPKSEDGGGARLTMTDTFSTISSVPAQSIVSGSVAGSQMQHSEKQTPQVWIIPVCINIAPTCLSLYLCRWYILSLDLQFYKLRKRNET